jgi:two-component system nitrogen regulation sensor histidine kinase NtrY
MLIRRVLTNLVENALQAAEGVGRVPEVVLRVQAEPDREDEPGRVDIVIDDNGPGVPAGARERIFDPYVTTKENGTGLGLAIVRKIVIDHGGDVILAAEPSPLGGARFTMAIPAAGPAAAAAPPPAPAPDPAASP